MFENQNPNQPKVEHAEPSPFNFVDISADHGALSSVVRKQSAITKEVSAEAKLLNSAVSWLNEHLLKGSEYKDTRPVEKNKLAENGELPAVVGKVADMTGPGITDKFGVMGTDLGVSIIAPNGKLISVFGDTFSGGKVGEGDWRSPVALIGTGDANHKIEYEYAAGADPNYAHQLIDYVHDNPGTGWSQGGISTIIPDDLLRVGQRIYLHGIENQGFGNVTGTGIWTSDDNGTSWQKFAQFPGSKHNGYDQCWSWDYNPDDGFVYVASTGFQRDKGIILQRVHPEDIGNLDKYSGWGFADGKWSWDKEPTPITPPGEKWGELSLRRLGHDQWILGGFEDSQYALGYRTINSPTADLFKTPVQNPVVGDSWQNDDPAHNKVAQLYGGFILPGSQLDKEGGVGLVVSQWNTFTGQTYKAMQFKATLKNTIGQDSKPGQTKV